MWNEIQLATVPEASSAMLLIGLGASGFAFRRSKR
ncbi:MAG: PEP-CTERM sorting domain-containing protein [Luteolibacter sp.]